ncbi:hypothetical protein ADUPG1_014327, partial [Aduncisulcus paluster]
NVGVGIKGNEGAAAARASDFAVCKFEHLRPLLFIHGRSCLRRFIIHIQYYLYKNIVLSGVAMLYVIMSAFSGSLIINQWQMTGFNTFYTFLPPFVFSLFDRPSLQSRLLKYPKNYADQRREYKSWRGNLLGMFVWLAEAVGLSVCLVIFCIFPYTKSVVDSSGYSYAGNELVGVNVTLATVFCVSLRLLMEVRTVNFWLFVCIIVSLIAFFGFSFLTNGIIELDYMFYWQFFMGLKIPIFWWNNIIVCGMYFVIIAFIQFAKRQCYPSADDVLHERFRNKNRFLGMCDRDRLKEKMTAPINSIRMHRKKSKATKEQQQVEYENISDDETSVSYS